MPLLITSTSPSRRSTSERNALALVIVRTRLTPLQIVLTPTREAVAVRARHTLLLTALSPAQ